MSKALLLWIALWDCSETNLAENVILVLPPPLQAPPLPKVFQTLPKNKQKVFGSLIIEANFALVSSLGVPSLKEYRSNSRGIFELCL